MALLEIKHIYKNFGGLRAIDDFSLNADPGEIHGIIGPNGAGKTTIFNTITGVYHPDQGEVWLDGNNITKLPQYKITHMGLGRTFQNIRIFKGLTVEENVMCAFDPQSKYSILGGILPTPNRIREEKRGRELTRKYLEVVGMLQQFYGQFLATERVFRAGRTLTTKQHQFIHREISLVKDA